jgi:hypothetical protein
VYGWWLGVLHWQTPVEPEALAEHACPVGQPQLSVPPVPLSSDAPHLPAYAELWQVSVVLQEPAPSVPLTQTWSPHQHTRPPVQLHARDDPQPVSTGALESLHSAPSPLGPLPPVQAGAPWQQLEVAHVVPVVAVHLLQV